MKSRPNQDVPLFIENIVYSDRVLLNSFKGSCRLLKLQVVLDLVYERE